MPIILTKRSNTPGAVPATANLTNAAGGAELAVNTADKRLFSINSSSAIIEVGTNPSSLTCADASFTVARVGSLTISSLSLTNVTVTSATVTTLTGTSANITNISGTSLTVSTATLNGGTANGVLYLNGSKVATSGTDLVFNATGLGIGTSSPGEKLTVSATANNAGKFTSTATTTALVLDNTNANGWGSNLAIFTGGTAAGYFGTIGSLLGSTTQDLAVYATAGNGFRVYTNGNNLRAIFDSSGNLGLGVTPSAWGASKYAMQLGSRASLYGASNLTVLGNNYYDNGTNNIFIASAAACDYYQSAGSHIWRTSTNPTPTAGNTVSFTQAMTLDASGRLLVGPTGDVAAGGYFGAGQFKGSYPALVLQGTEASAKTWQIGENAGALAFYNTTDGERARITSGGVFCVNSTSNVGGEVTLFKQTSGVSSPATRFWNNSTTGDNEFVEFATETSYTARGSITYNRGGGLVAYNTTSDYRAKDILGPVQNSGATIDALKVYEGQMKGATQGRPMLVAHEAQEHAPYAVTGEKDAVNEDGTPKYQQMDVSALVPLLLAEIQSLRARVAQLESK
jgi:hypothetical protein